MKIYQTLQTAIKPLGELRQLRPKTFGQKMLMTSTFTGVFLAMMPLAYPFAVYCFMAKSSLPLAAALASAAGVLGTIGAIGGGLNALLDLQQYGLNPDKPLRYKNSKDQTVEGPRRKVVQLYNLQCQVSSLSYKLTRNANNETAKASLRDIFARADKLMEGVKIIDAGKRGASAEKYEYSAECDITAYLPKPAQPTL